MLVSPDGIEVLSVMFSMQVPALAHNFGVYYLYRGKSTFIYVVCFSNNKVGIWNAFIKSSLESTVMLTYCDYMSGTTSTRV